MNKHDVRKRFDEYDPDFDAGFDAAWDSVASEVQAVLLELDHLAQVWGDEGVFRRCRDRLRDLIGDQQ